MASSAWDSASDGLESRMARLASGARTALRTGAPALAFVYLVLVWVVFTGTLLAIPDPGKGLGARVLAGLAGL